MDIAIIGAGALGGFYGSRLHAAGHRVHLLARSDAAAGHMAGFACRSPLGDVTIPGDRVYSHSADLPPCDLVIVSLKTVDNHRLKELLPACLADTGVVLVLQNGLGVEEEAAAVVGGERVYGGLCFLCANKVAPAQVEHLAYGKVSLGRHGINGQAMGIDEPLRRIGQAFMDGGIAVSLTEDLTAARWQKLVWNIPYNGLCTVLDCDTQVLTTHSDTRMLVDELMQEVVQGAAACGKTISAKFVQEMVHNTDAMGPYLPSMLLDRRAGRAMEIEHMFGNPLRSAMVGGTILPRIDCLYRQLRFINSRS
ncbi:MAG: 2-dehydropantoate 2-reductase [Planctomycetota bacterium]|nr:MAG: 2-dehydropantoate 2-reductase [Planctomycetota bacterium]